MTIQARPTVCINFISVGGFIVGIEDWGWGQDVYLSPNGYLFVSNEKGGVFLGNPGMWCNKYYFAVG